jgi:hypothetical protein
MANKAQMTGMRGVFLVAAELTEQRLVVSPTSRSAFGADLLVADQKCRRAWSVQVKTNAGRPTFWLLKHARGTKSDSHIFVLVNLGEKNPRRKPGELDFMLCPAGSWRTACIRRRRGGRLVRFSTRSTAIK